MNNVFYCDACQKEVGTSIETIAQELMVKDKKLKVNIQIRKCTHCGEEVWDEELERKNDVVVFGAYRIKKGFLSPKQIKEIRETIGVSQSGFSIMLGFGAKTIARYENGAPQDSAHDLLIRLMQNRKNVRIAYEKAYDSLGVRDRNRVTAYLSEVSELRKFSRFY